MNVESAGMVLAQPWIVIAPLVTTLCGATLCVMASRAERLRNLLLIVTLLLATMASWRLAVDVIMGGSMAMTMGNWPPPFGISFSVDAAAALLNMTAMLTTTLIVVHKLRDTTMLSRNHPLMPALILILISGVSGAFLTGDIFNLYVWLEVILIAAFGLLVCGGRALQLDGAIKYAFLNLLATTLFLIATALLYGVGGTLNMADLHERIGTFPNQGILPVIGLLYVVAVGMKAALFPLFFWLPASYHTPYGAVAALFAALLTKVGIYILLRLLTLIFAPVPFIDMWALGLVGLATLFGAVTGMLAERNPRRFLGWTVISGVGMLTLGLAFSLDDAASGIALQAVLYYMIHAMLGLAVFYLLAEMVLALRDRAARQGETEALWATHPLLSGLFMTTLAVMAGIPPFSGFWAKLLLLQAGLVASAYGLVVGLLIGSVLMLIALGRFGVTILMEPPRQDEGCEGVALPSRCRLTPGLALLFGLLMVIGFLPNMPMQLSEIAALQILNPAAYVAATQGVAP